MSALRLELVRNNMPIFAQHGLHVRTLKPRASITMQTAASSIIVIVVKLGGKWGGGGGGGSLMRAQYAILCHTTGLHQSQGLPYPPDRLHLRDVQDNYWGQPGPI